MAAVPFDLGGYRPDVIVRKQDQALIVEVKVSAEKTSFDGLRSIVDEVKRNKGWQFILVTAQDLLADPLNEREEQFSWDELNYRIDNAER